MLMNKITTGKETSFKNLDKAIESAKNYHQKILIDNLNRKLDDLKITQDHNQRLLEMNQMLQERHQRNLEWQLERQRTQQQWELDRLKNEQKSRSLHDGLIP